MSEIRVDEITDEAGTGAPQFPNGIRVDEITDEAGTGAPDFTNGITVSGSFTSLGIDDNATSTAMTLDSSGNLLVGKTSQGPTIQGVEALADGQVNIKSADNSPLIVGRGDFTSGNRIAAFRQGDTMCIEIGYQGSAGYIDGQSGDTGIKFEGAHWRPRDNGADVDNLVDLGSGAFRFDDVNATNGTIQTSDRNEKQQISSLTTAEIAAAKAISQLFKTFKWNSAVTSKGDAARTHTGVIAQEVETAMTDAGLDAGDYAFFTSNTWWEDTEDYTDDDGVQQTRTNTYDTLAEAPAGATERTRKGIRYPELLSFVGAATEQRLADIETRLTALEAV